MQLKLDWTELDNEEAIIAAIEKFNKIIKEKNQRYFNIGSAKGCEICIDDKCIKEFHCYFKYLDTENRWIVMDYNQNIMPMALQKD